MVLERIGSISLLASTASAAVGSMDLKRMRTVTITATCTFGAASDGNLRVNLFYQPDKRKSELRDTEAFTAFDLTLSAGNKVTRSVQVDMPENGNMQFEVDDLGTAGQISGIEIWANWEKWEKEDS